MKNIFVKSFEEMYSFFQCQDKTEDFPTTCEDLAGFWDMVSIQVNNVHDEFDKIDALRASGWKEQVSKR